MSPIPGLRRNRQLWPTAGLGDAAAKFRHSSQQRSSRNRKQPYQPLYNHHQLRPAAGLGDAAAKFQHSSAAAGTGSSHTSPTASRRTTPAWNFNFKFFWPC